MKFVFPVLDRHGGADPVELIPARVVTSATGRRPLQRSEIDTLDLNAVWLAADRLGIPLRARGASWSISCGGADTPVLHGPSAQLAAFLAAASAHCLRTLRPRGWLTSISEVWATGALRLHDPPTQPGLAPLTEGQTEGQAIQAKARCFARSAARLFLLHADDLGQCRSILESVDGVRILNMDNFRAILRRQPDSSFRFVVGVQSHELFTLLEAMFRGLVLRNAGALLANVFTAARIPLGGFTAYVLCTADDFGAATTAYLLGLATDVIDGAMARRFQGTSDFGKKFDRWVDIGFNGLVGFGFIAGALLNWGTLAEAILFFSLTGALVALTYPIVDPRCTIPKLRSAWIRVVILVFLARHVRVHMSMVAWVLLCMLGLTLIAIAVYEVDLLRRELVLGRRVAWIRFQPWFVALIKRIGGASI